MVGPARPGYSFSNDLEDAVSALVRVRVRARVRVRVRVRVRD